MASPSGCLPKETYNGAKTMSETLGNQHINDMQESAAGAMHKMTDAAKETYQTVSAKVDDAVVRGREYVREKPVHVLLGALAFGAAIGCVVMMTRRKPATLRERFAGDPVGTAREILRETFGSVGHGVHQAYDSAREGAGKAMHKLNRSASDQAETWSDRLAVVGNKLKFW